MLKGLKNIFFWRREFERETRIMSPIESVFHAALLDEDHSIVYFENRYREIMLRWREDGQLIYWPEGGPPDKRKRMTPAMAALKAKQDFCDWYRRDVWRPELGEEPLAKMAYALAIQALTANKFQVEGHVNLLNPFWRHIIEKDEDYFGWSSAKNR